MAVKDETNNQNNIFEGLGWEDQARELRKEFEQTGKLTMDTLAAYIEADGQTYEADKPAMQQITEEFLSHLKGSADTAGELSKNFWSSKTEECIEVTAMLTYALNKVRLQNFLLAGRFTEQDKGKSTRESADNFDNYLKAQIAEVSSVIERYR